MQAGRGQAQPASPCDESVDERRNPTGTDGRTPNEGTPEHRSCLPCRLPSHGAGAAWQRFLDAFEPLRPELYRYCRYLTRSPWDAEDLVQDTFARGFVTLGCMTQDVPNPRGWLFRVASHLWIDRTRRMREEPGDVPETASFGEPRATREAAGTLIVFSRTLKKLDWKNSRLASADVAEEIGRLKRQPGKDIALFGSADLASTLMRPGLIDEYRFFVNPVVPGSGNPTFKNLGEKLSLKLLKATPYRSGNVLLYYQPA